MKAIRILQNQATGRKVLFLFILTNCIYLSILLYSIPRVTERAAGMQLFDMSPFGYSHAYAQNLLAAIGAEGREVYLRLQLPIDFVYPGLFALTYSMMLVWLFKKRFDPESKVFLLALAPAVAGFFDYMENVGIIVMLQQYPALTRGMVSVSSVFSVLKSIWTVLFYVILVFGLIRLLAKGTRRSHLRN